MSQPLKRACIELAYRVVMAQGNGDEIYVGQDKKTIFQPGGITKLGRDSTDLAILLLASAIEAKVSSGQAVDAGNDLRASEVGEVLAKQVDDHLSTVSVFDYAFLDERRAMYRHDVTSRKSAAPTNNAGDS